jgi:hypothetical protein
MKNNMSDQLKSSHILYSKTHKVIWTISVIFFLIGGLQIGGGIYANHKSATINTNVNYGDAISGNTNLDRVSENSDLYGESILNGFKTSFLGLVGFGLGIFLRRRSRQFMTLPGNLNII